MPEGDQASRSGSSLRGFARRLQPRLLLDQVGEQADGEDLQEGDEDEDGLVAEVLLDEDVVVEEAAQAQQQREGDGSGPAGWS